MTGGTILECLKQYLTEKSKNAQNPKCNVFMHLKQCGGSPDFIKIVFVFSYYSFFSNI